MSRWLWLLTELSNRLWLRASIYGIIAVITALVSIYARRFIPSDIPQKIGADAVDGILNILASSMLAVTIFSVSTMVSAYSAATNNVTPRATRLLLEDKVSHSSLSTFIGSFIFSIVGIIALRTGAYGDSGRLILFVVTIFIIVVIIVTLLRWIEYLSRLGRVSETVERVEKVTADALQERLDTPFLGGTPNLSNESGKGAAVFYNSAGYVQHIDMSLLSDIAKKLDYTIFIHAMPGKFVDPSFALATTSGKLEEDNFKDIRKAFIIGRERSFRQDPRFGFAVLSEIAIRALSPAVNDPGTAIYVIGVGLRTLLLWADRPSYSATEEEIKYPLVYVPALTADDLFDNFFSPIARDGAGILEVSLRLQKAFIALNNTDDDDLKRAAVHYSRISFERSMQAFTLQEDKERLSELATNITGN